MPLRFDAPLWLLALVAVPVVVALGRRSATARTPATAVRAVAVAALVLAVAGPGWEAAGRGLDLVVVVDASDSTAVARDEALGWVDGALEARSGGDRVALAAVGRDAQVEHALREDPPPAGLSVRVDGSETDLARGLRLAQGLAGSEQHRRVVLLTDGHATRGDAADAVRRLEASGVPVDVVRIGGDGRADVLVEGVRAPSTVRDGDAYDVTVTLRNTRDAEAGGQLTVSADGEVVHREPVALPPGRTEVRVPREAGEEGSVRYEARLSSAASTERRNDTGAAAVRVEGPASVLLVEGADADERHADNLARLLEAGGLPVVRHPATAGFPSADELLEHEAAVLADVHVDAVGEAGEAALDAYVRDAGRGLVVVGGPSSYGAGGYDGTRLESLLPVFARVEDPERRPSVAQALVVDASGSMAACHCRPGGFAGGPGPVEGGPDKTAISRAAVARAIDNLDAQDTVGVLAFHTEAEWVLPLQSVPERAIVDAALGRLHPEGDTAIGTGLQEAIEGLKDAEARLRHIVLFSDGFTNERGLEDVAAQAAEEGITVSVVGTGEGSGEVLERVASAGGGRFYPGIDLSSIPSVLAGEVQMVARSLIEEGEFPPIVTAADEVTDRIERAPPLLGYVATTAKPAARTQLRIGDERDPLLATWQAGLGTVVSWTSDAGARWSAPWLDWDGARELWGAIVRSALPADEGAGVDAAASVTPEGLELRLLGHEDLPADVGATAVVVGPDGQRREVPMSRVDLDAFEATVPTGGDGVHVATMRLERAGAEQARRTVTAVRSYPAEYAAPTGGDEAARELVGALGRLDPEPAEAFSRAGAEPGRTPRDLTSAFLLLALVALPLDVGLRRLRLERADLRRWRPGRSRAATPRTATPASPRDGSGPHPAPVVTEPVPADAGPGADPSADGGPEAEPAATDEEPGETGGNDTSSSAQPSGAARLLEARRRARRGGGGPPAGSG